MIDRRWNYICDCSGTKYYFSEESTTPAYTAMGYEADKTWTCDGDSLDVDLATGFCYKGEEVLDYDATLNWCHGIPLAIHRYDIIDWTERTAGAPLPLVDLVNGICKQPDKTWS